LYPVGCRLAIPRHVREQFPNRISYESEFGLLINYLMAPRLGCIFLPEQSVSWTDRDSEMTHVSSVHPQPSAVAPTGKIWASAFPIVIKLRRELFRQLARSYASELPSARIGAALRQEHNHPLAHASGTQPGVQHVKTDLTMSAPGSPPAGCVRGPACPRGRPTPHPGRMRRSSKRAPIKSRASRHTDEPRMATTTSFLESSERVRRMSPLGKLGVASALSLSSMRALAEPGDHGEGHDRWHAEFYSKLPRPDTTTSCCNLADCRPTEVRPAGDHYEVKKDRR
jgi:hypothetical protein